MLQAKNGAPCQRQEELGEGRTAVLGVSTAVVARKTGGRIGRIGDPPKLQLLDHETRHDLLVARKLVLRLVLQQLRLADQERNHAVALLRELVVHVAQPLQPVFRKPLGFVAQQHHHMTLAQQQLLMQPAHESEALLGVRHRLRIAYASGGQERYEERPFIGAAMVLARQAQHQQVWPLAAQVQAEVLDHMGLAHAWPRVDQRTRDHHPHAQLYQVHELLDRRRGDAVVAPAQRMVGKRQSACRRGQVVRAAQPRGAGAVRRAPAPAPSRRVSRA